MFKNAKGCFIILVVLMGVGYGFIQVFKRIKQNSIDEANNASVVAYWSANAWLNYKPSQLKGLEWKGAYIEMDGYICDYFESSDGDYYLELTAAVQTDSSVAIARTLNALNLVKGEIWSPCDSSMYRVQQLYNFQESATKLFIHADVIDFMPGVDMGKLNYNQPCRYYHGKQKRYYQQLQNFCYNNVSLKARVQSVKAVGDSLYVSLDNGIVTKLNDTNWKFN